MLTFASISDFIFAPWLKVMRPTDLSKYKIGQTEKHHFFQRDTPSPVVVFDALTNAIDCFAFDYRSPDFDFSVSEEMGKILNLEPGVYKVNLLEALKDVSENALNRFLSLSPSIPFNLKVSNVLVGENNDLFYGKIVRCGHHPLQRGEYYLHMAKKK